MEFGKVLKKAMVDAGIDGAKALSDKSGVSYYITLRLLSSDSTVRLKDLANTAEYLGVEIKFIKVGM